MRAVRGKGRSAVAAVAATGAALTVIGMLPATAATAATDGTATRAAGSSTAATRSYTYLSFKKNSSNPTNSRLSLIYVQQSGDRVHSFTVASWRAGSGNGSRNSCARNAGWLPNGTYKIRAFYNHHNGGPRGVNGISWLLNDARCSNGTPRTALFIHSEMLPSGAQGRSEPYRWDGNSDYKSAGCIKLKPSDVRQLKGYRANYPHPTKLYVG
ncbi:L,D-transpeptidase family protein [Streptomyces longwoodensis]|uniref:L,D-transpeptidase family protein n=1 Tax=Streptomyces longwoodensis TaxID=68231 RepID=UPI0036FE5279